MDFLKTSEKTPYFGTFENRLSFYSQMGISIHIERHNPHFPNNSLRRPNRGSNPHLQQGGQQALPFPPLSRVRRVPHPHDQPHFRLLGAEQPQPQPRVLPRHLQDVRGPHPDWELPLGHTLPQPLCAPISGSDPVPAPRSIETALHRDLGK